MNKITDRIAMTNSEIAERFKAIGYHLCLEDDPDFIGDEEHIVITSDTLDDFRAARLSWSAPGRVVESPEGTLVIQRAQASRGQQREDVVVVDFGDVRLVWRP